MKSFLCFLLLLFAAPSLAAPSGENPSFHCSLWRDSSGLLHARAEDSRSTLACMGYGQGVDRAWQIDYYRRAAQGTLSEVLGKSFIERDYFMRLLGLPEKAKQLFVAFSPEDRTLYESFASGINAGMADARRQGIYEFQTLGYEPEPWSPVDSVALLLLMSFDQTQATFKQELTENQRRLLFGDRAQALFDQNQMPWDTAILKDGEDSSPNASRPAQTDLSSLARALAIPPQPITEVASAGSNSWALAPFRGAGHHAWLANDPHLALQSPSFWHWIHLSGANGVDVAGVGIPGAPLIVSGLNRHIAWGLTNSYIDVADVVAVSEEELRERMRFLPIVWFRFWKFKIPVFFKILERTKEGWPILPIEAPEGKKLVLKWSALRLKPEQLSGLTKLFSVQSAAQFDSLLSGIGLPSWNFTFADTKGNIGFRTIGLVPKRSQSPAFGVAEASVDQLNSWTYLSAQEMPHLLTPKRGWVVTANNRHWNGTVGKDGGRAYAQSFRAFRIEELLRARETHDRSSLQAIQCDIQAVDARFLLPVMLKGLAGQAQSWSPKESQAIELLKGWDFQMTKECRACGVYALWLHEAKEHAKMNETALYRSTSGEADPTTLRVLNEAFHTAVAELSRIESTSFPRWGEIHLAEFRHMSGDARLSAPDALSTPGSAFSVNPGFGKWNGNRFDHTDGASERLLVEMTSPPRAYFRLAGPDRDAARSSLSKAGSPWKAWEECSYGELEFPLDWSRVQAERVAF